MWFGSIPDYSASPEDGGMQIAGTSPGSPAEKAGLLKGDVILQVGDVQVGDIVEKAVGEPVSTLAEMFRTVWAVGPAGAEIPLTVIRDGERLDLTVASISRGELLKGPRLH